MSASCTADDSEEEEYGYDAIFAKEVPDELKCVVCHLVLRDPLQISSCGHRFCRPCFNRMKNNAYETTTDFVCPVDREVVVLSKVFEDRGIARTVGNLKTQCTNVNQGCEWMGDLRDLQKHRIECTHRTIAEMDRLSLHSRNRGELKPLLNEILTRLQTCEDDLILKERDITELGNGYTANAQNKLLTNMEVKKHLGAIISAFKKTEHVLP